MYLISLHTRLNPMGVNVSLTLVLHRPTETGSDKWPVIRRFLRLHHLLYISLVYCPIIRIKNR